MIATCEIRANSHIRKTVSFCQFAEAAPPSAWTFPTPGEVFFQNSLALRYISR